jgi:lipoprotein-anchoring transpeptidase ErfK/SrfK
MSQVVRFGPALSIILALAAAMAACSSAGGRESGVIIEPLRSPSATARSVPTGGKPAPPTATATVDALAAEPTDAATDATATDEPAPTATAQPVGPPSSGRWIEVDVTNFVVRLMDGAAVVQEIAPVAVGAQVDTGEYLSTQTGLFQVHSKVADLVYDAPFDTYISHWVGFDPDKDNGFHSFLKDAAGNVVDPSTGRVSNGCIRTGDAEALYAFAEIGMPVWVHA